MLIEEFPRTGSIRELSTCGAVMLDDGTIHWRVWAPAAESVQLVLVAEDGSRSELPMERELSGYFVQDLGDTDEGQRYGFRLNDGPLRPDPAPSVSGGCGLDAMWNDDFHHAVHALFTGERHGYYVDYGQPEQLVKALNQTFVYDGCHSTDRGHRYGTEVNHRSGDQFVASIQNHDQVGNRAWGDRFGTLLSPAQQRLVAGLLLLSPHVPLLFMGEEYSETRPFAFFCSFEDQGLVETVRRGRREEFAKFACPLDVLLPYEFQVYGPCSRETQ